MQSTSSDQKLEAPVSNTTRNTTHSCTATSSEEEYFCITLSSNVDPIPINRIHGWTLHLENAKGEPVDNAKILVYGGMPAHKHGFPTNPRVTENLGGGNYLLDGVKFSMHGQWEIWLNITVDKIRDKAVFEVNVM
ncbi:FixH family protein [Kaarinaea lacus]